MIRRAGLRDAAAIARIEVETWRTTYAGILSDNVLTGMSVQHQARQWAFELRHGTVWLWDDGGVLGFGHGGRQRNSRLAFEGEVYTLYVLPDAQGMGIGRQLLLAVLAELVDCGMKTAVVWVLRDNPSRFFYERMGARLALHRRIAVGGQPVEALGYAWTDLAASLRQHGHTAAG